MILPTVGHEATSSPVVFPIPSTGEEWSYKTAFSRNTGLISDESQHRLHNCRVAIPGMGGVGGVHLITLARLGVGSFTIADADEYSVANFNRQYGATVSSIGACKATTMAKRVRDINPEAGLSVFKKHVTLDNIDEFLAGVDIVVDSVDFFSIDARRMIFQEARRRGIWAITAGPIGFGTAWLVFDPNGMSFDEYFDLNDDMSSIEKLVSFAVGLAPKALQASYMDLSKIDLTSGAAPSVGLACQLASGVVAAEIVKVVTRQGRLRPVPCYQQFDAHKMRFVKGTLRWGNRGPIQKLKRVLLKKVCQRNGILQMAAGNESAVSL